MERDFPSTFISEGSGFLFTAFNGQTTEQRSFNTSFSAFSSVNHEKTPFHGADYGIGTSLFGFPIISTSDPVAFSDFHENMTEFQQKQLNESSINGDRFLKSIDIDSEKLRFPKPEPVDEEWINGTSIEPFNSRSENYNRTLNPCNSSIYQLPYLRSLEQVSLHHGEQTPCTEDLSVVESSLKRLRSSSSTDSYTLEAIVRNIPLSTPSSFASLKAPNPAAPSVIPQSVLARQRRKMISDRTRCLQKLMPWDRKMDMATLLEEAYKYIKYLQAQVSVLQSMPLQTSFTASQVPVNVGGVFGGLEKLNRQQLLQVLVNSPVAQTVLYSQGCCVYSLEQLLLLKKIAAKKILL